MFEVYSPGGVVLEGVLTSGGGASLEEVGHWGTDLEV